jgi:hypothetical protein
MRATVDAYYEKMNSYYDGMIAIIKECLGRTEAKKEPTPEGPKAVAEP